MLGDKKRQLALVSLIARSKKKTWKLGLLGSFFSIHHPQYQYLPLFLLVKYTMETGKPKSVFQTNFPSALGLFSFPAYKLLFNNCQCMSSLDVLYSVNIISNTAHGAKPNYPSVVFIPKPRLYSGGTIILWNSSDSFINPLSTLLPFFPFFLFRLYLDQVQTIK